MQGEWKGFSRASEDVWHRVNCLGRQTGSRKARRRRAGQHFPVLQQYDGSSSSRNRLPSRPMEGARKCVAYNQFKTFGPRDRRAPAARPFAALLLPYLAETSGH